MSTATRITAVLAAILMAVPLVFLGRPGPVAAQGDRADFCVEPNDEFQQACDLPVGQSAAGRLFHANDVDAYRVVALDFDATLRVELTEMPRPYRITVLDWNGKSIATSAEQGTAELPLPVPGVYYVMVDSRTGEFTDEAPYRLRHTLSYAAGAAPILLDSASFGQNAAYSSPRGYSVVWENGRLTIALENSGSEQSPFDHVVYASNKDGQIHAADVVMVVDARAVAGSQPGSMLEFRNPNTVVGGYQLMVNHATRQARLALYDHQRARRTVLSEWTTVESIEPAGVSRLVVRAVGTRITGFVNGQQVADVENDRYAEGRMSFGGLTWDDPATIRFDNLLVTRK